MLVPRESEGDPLLVVKFWLIVAGIYIWEFLTTLHFEWSVIRGRRRYRWTIWIYSLSRLSGLAVIILTLVGFFCTTPINCQAWVTSGWVFSAIGGYGLGSVLIMIRIYAIWDRSKIIMAISAAIWVVNLGFQLEGIVKIRAVWVPEARSCAITNVEICKNFYINLLATDVILLFIMLTGLLRLRLSAGGTLYLSHLLWKQGVIWLAIATAAELPQVLLLFLNLNDSLNLLFLLPSMVAIIIAATRTYRSLINSAHPRNLSETLAPSTLQRSKRVVSDTKDTTVVHIPSNRLEVKVDQVYHEEYSMSQTNHYGSTDTQLADNSHELDSDENVEGRDRK